MTTLTVRKVPAEIHRAIKVRAAQHGRSTEAEIREILSETVHTRGRLRIGSELRRFAEQFRGVDLTPRRSRAPIKPARFE